MMKRYSLKELLKIKNGRPHQNLSSGKYPVYGSGGIMRYVNQYLYDKPSILLPRKGTLSNIQYTETPFWTVDTTYYTEVNTNLVNVYYLYSYLSLLDLQMLNSGTGVPSMTFDSYYNIEVSLPDITTQSKIARILSAIDEKISINKKINHELENMAKELYDYWFVQFDFPNENGKPYKSSGGKMQWNKTLKRAIPEGWEVKKLGDCYEHITTGLNPRNNFKLGNGNIKYITVKNLNLEGSIDFDNCDLINEAAKKLIHARSNISKGDILFASISPLGRCFIIQETPKDWDINESVFSIRPKNDIITSEYLYEYFTSELFIKKSENLATGSIFAGIRINSLNNMPVIISDKKTMQKFSKILAPIFKQKYKLLKENSKLSQLHNELLPLLMNGQVVIKS